MKNQKLERSRITFMERMSSKDPKTLRSYNMAINNFENFCMEKYGKADFVSELKEYDNDTLFDFLQSWINWNNKLLPSTTRILFSRIKKYLYHRGVKLHQQDINEELEFRTQIQEERYGLTLNDIQTIIKNMRYKHKTQFICQLSSLMRIGELTQLRKKHLISDKQNIIVKIPATIAKLKKGRTTFFSKEASTLLRPILRKIEDNDLVFGIKSDVNVAQILRRVLKKTGLDMKYESSGDFMINTHSFRAYGITKLSRRDPNFAKKIAGQKGYLDQYDRITDEEKLTLYQKFEDDLIIDDSEKQKAEIKKLESKKSELESLRLENKDLNKNIKEIVNDIVKNTMSKYFEMQCDYYLPSEKKLQEWEEALKIQNAKLAKIDGIEDTDTTTDETIAVHNKLVKKIKKTKKQ